MALCETGRLADYQSPGNFFVLRLLPAQSRAGLPLLGASTEELRSWGYRSTTVPSIDSDNTRCAGELGVRATLCWARLDQLVVARLAAIPIGEAPVVHLKSVRVASHSLDQAFGEPSLSRIA